MRAPRIMRAWAALGLAYAADGLSRILLRIARRIERRRTTAEAYDLAIGVRAIARELGVSRRRAWHLIRSGAVRTTDLGGAPCASRVELRAYHASPEKNDARWL